MRVLAIDTSSNVATVAVMEDELLLGEYILNHKKTHSQKIMTMIEQILSELELTVRDIDIFAAAIGPGSFTGLRIGVATVKALAHATGKPVVSVGTLEALAYNVPYAEHIIVPIMDARRDNVFTASYIWDEGFKEIGEPEAIGIDEPRNMSFVAKKLSVTVGTLTIAVNNLVKKGYVNRTRSEKDRRVVLISLTEKGRRAYEHHRLFHDKMIKATIANMSEQEEEVLAQALTNLIGFFEQYQQ